MVAQQKPQQILQLEPSGEIVFNGPFEHVVTSYLELKNPSDKRVCFKVKTTAPRRYCVRPNSGIIEPDAKTKIAIMLQPMDADSQAERSKHKFMVQSTVINGDYDSQQTDEIWQNASPEKIMDSKLRCVFHTPDQEERESSPSKRNAESTADAARSTVSSPSAAPVASNISSTQQQQQQQQQQQPKAARGTSGDGKQSSTEPLITSTPVASRVSSSTTKPPYAAAVASSSVSGPSTSQYGKRTDAYVSVLRPADKSVASNLTSSFLQPMSDDYKIVLVSLAMLILGVMLGKYII